MFLKLKKINEIFSEELLNFEKIFKVDLWIFKNEKKVSKSLIELVKLFLRAIYNSIFTYPLIISTKSKNQSIFYIRALVRPDLDKHSQYYENLDDTTVCLVSKRTKKIDITKFLLCIFFIIKLRRAWLKELNNEGVNFFSISGLEIFINFFSALSDVLKILPLLLKHTKLVSFQEMLMVENLICQIANIFNMKTFALQHALGSYKEKGSFGSRYAICHYLNSVCKNILCWGDYNKLIFEKHTNAKIDIVGKSSLPDKEIFLEGVTLIFENIEFYKANQKMFSFYSNLIDIGVPVSRWFKPQNVLVENTSVRDGPLRKIVIGCNSSMLVELGFLGGYVFVVQGSNIENRLPNNLILEDINLNFMKDDLLKNYPNHIWKEFIECTGRDSVVRYQDIVMNDL